MKKRLTLALVTGALVAGMLPGMAYASGAPSGYNEVYRDPVSGEFASCAYDFWPPRSEPIDRCIHDFAGWVFVGYRPTFN